MRILLFALTDTYETVITALEEKGHTVKLITQYSRLGINIYYGSPEAVKWSIEEIRKFSPDVVVNNMPPLMLPLSDDYTYFGNTRESARLELCKWETRQKAWEFGFELPEVVAECNLHEMPRFPYTTFLKSKGNDTWCQAWKVTPETDIEKQNEVFSTESNCPAYVERAIEFEVEGYCQFMVSNGGYSINDMKATHGDVSAYKELDGSTDWREVTYLTDLTQEQYDVFRPLCDDWLEYVATLGGNYEGNIGVGITKDLKVYWFEQNSRLSMYTQFQGDADSWIDSFTTRTEDKFWDLGALNNYKENNNVGND